MNRKVHGLSIESVYLSVHSFFIPKMKKKIHLFCFSIICSNIEKRKMEFCFLISFIEREDHYFSLNNYLIKHFFKFQKNHDFQY